MVRGLRPHGHSGLAVYRSVAPVGQAKGQRLGVFEGSQVLPMLCQGSRIEKMCLLAVFFRVTEDALLIVGANREELYARGGEPPRILEGPCRALAGIDPAAGGTWLGVNERGVLVAVTNRSKSEVPKQPRSRGLLARDLLACPSAAPAVDLATKEIGSNRYAGCNILCADGDRA